MASDQELTDWVKQQAVTVRLKNLSIEAKIPILGANRARLYALAGSTSQVSRGVHHLYAINVLRIAYALTHKVPWHEAKEAVDALHPLDS